MNFQESATILNACTKKSGNLLKAPCICILFLPLYLPSNGLTLKDAMQPAAHPEKKEW